MSTERRFRTFEITLLISALLHLGGLLLFSRSRPVADLGFDLQEISFMDVTYRPEVAKVLSQTPTPSLGGGTTVSEGAVPTYATGIAAEEVAPLDMNAKLERSPSQAKIELDRYELAREGEIDVIRIGGKGSSQTTEEILQEKPIPLARGPVGGGGMDLRGVPGVPQPQLQPELSIEHRPLTKPATTPTLPPPTSPQSQPTIQAPVSKGTSFQVAGPISQREIVNKVKPRYPQWALDQRVSGTVTVRIWVMPNGKVKGAPQVVASSGYPELDKVVIEAVRSWEFAPLSPGVKAEDQWGDITFIFQLS